jgi:hypothetical protein
VLSSASGFELPGGLKKNPKAILPDPLHAGFLHFSFQPPHSKLDRTDLLRLTIGADAATQF